MRQPRYADGTFAPKTCPNPMCDGRLSLEDDEWRCYGLVDPEDDAKPLTPCDYVHNPEEPSP